MNVCAARGPVSRELLGVLSQPTTSPAGLEDTVRDRVSRSTDPLDDEDLQLALYLMYELHYAGLDGVDDRWEWSPGLLAARAVIEDRFEAELRRRFAGPDRPPEPRDLPAALFELTREVDGPVGGALAAYVARAATDEQVRELMVLRSVYQLKEADPHTFAIPRLRGAAKAALVEIQADEYGGGRPERMHAELFARSLRGLGLEPAPNHYLAHVPADWLAMANALSMFGLHRRLRGALCGHLAAFEMTSSLPCRRYVTGLERLGHGRDVTEFFDEHVEADAVHEQVAAHDLCGNLVLAEPGLVGDVMFGATVGHRLAARLGDRVLRAWQHGRSALRSPLPPRDLHASGVPGAAA